jgi:hypothetical protein
MQNGCISDASIQELRVSSKAGHYLIDYPEQDIVAICLVVQEQVVQFIGYCKDHVEIIDRQKICFPFSEPSFTLNISTFGTVAVPATVIDDLFMAAMFAMFNPSTHGFGTALPQCMQGSQMMTGKRMFPVQFSKEVLYNSCDFGPGGLHQDNVVG